MTCLLFTGTIFAPWFLRVGKRTLAGLCFKTTQAKCLLVFFVEGGRVFEVAEKYGKNNKKYVKKEIIKNRKVHGGVISPCRDAQPCQLSVPNSQKPGCESLKPICFDCCWNQVVAAANAVQQHCNVSQLLSSNSSRKAHMNSLQTLSCVVMVSGSCHNQYWYLVLHNRNALLCHG